MHIFQKTGQNAVFFLISNYAARGTARRTVIYNNGFHSASTPIKQSYCKVYVSKLTLLASDSKTSILHARRETNSNKIY